MPPQFTLRRGRCPVRYPNQIREYRLRARFTQRDLAKEIGGSRSMISAYECGQMLPSVPNLFKLARTLSTLCEALYPALRAPEPGSDPSVEKNNA
jgi:transcriptional regulator with XRE-family HTH domain